MKQSVTRQISGTHS